MPKGTTKPVLGIEFGSTRIKATLIGSDFSPIASGSHQWENRLDNGVWTYSEEEIWSGLADAYSDLGASLEGGEGAAGGAEALSLLAALGFSGMMHGYIALDADNNLLVPFRTWRNNITGEASKKLTELFSYPIPQRWSIAHLYQAMLNGEEHLQELRRLATLAVYVQLRLTGEFVVGIGEASGMFPVDAKTGDYEKTALDAFDGLLKDHGLPFITKDILPRIVPAGSEAGRLTEAGAKLIDRSGRLAPGLPLCPPEGDADTGMVATNSIRPRTGNVSAGTSVFAMLVLEKPLSRVHEEIDLVMTPDGNPVAMVHANNGLSDFDAWMGLLAEAAAVAGADIDVGELIGKVMPLALDGDADAGGLLSYGYVSGEHLTGFSEGRPAFFRSENARFTLANFVRAHLLSTVSAMKVGLNILTGEEGVRVDEINGHGGLFKTPEVGARIMAAASETPVRVLETAGEGGPWGMALLAAYVVREQPELSLAEFLEGVFASAGGTVVPPDTQDVHGFLSYFERYQACLPAEKSVVKLLK